ncbi:hypothetical protein AYO47_08555 [Planctomyces sp. SCGC AG-212-M04]|nr:hypothetical protein AYO47_08555 [Planctomyces sp. SCGC AG-212-M04]
MVLVCFGAWSSRPQVDQRFVGTWSGQIPAIPPYFVTFEFWEDGTGSSTSAGYADDTYTTVSTAPPRPLCWWVKDDKLFVQITSQIPSPMVRFCHSLGQAITRRGGFKVIQFDGKQMILRRGSENLNDASNDIKLQRTQPQGGPIPE